ncbi:conserved hypothetical protein [Candidatus Desulfarcum epimagneticum]|uniref:Mce/MlaD domain-containing protein n=1 Tax=uncultured Desulfobacteraceae bacterium TaxID=218296 RepID=A0A484HJF5_9BACT|nr:conserved hypothetical protein [uncultured Desulfobacteraceae bacterium]
MSLAKTHFRVGLFLFLGGVLAVSGVIWIGAAHYFDRGRLYECYFDESVQGLGKDSPVKYRGVAIGRVKSIGVAPDGNLIRVVMQIESQLQNGGDDVAAQLKSVGITGIMFIELDRKSPEDPKNCPDFSFPTRHPVIVTRPSGIKKLAEGIDSVIRRFMELDLKGVSESVKESLDVLNQNVKDARIKEISLDIRDSFSRVREILKDEKWDRIMISMEDMASSLAEFSKTSQNAVKSGERLLKNTDAGFASLQRRLVAAARNLEISASNLNSLIEMLKDQPSRVIFSRPPPERRFEKKEDSR